MDESNIKSKVLSRLKHLLRADVVVWYRVLHNGMFYWAHGGGIVHMGKPIFGQVKVKRPNGYIEEYPQDLDIMVLVNTHDKRLKALFLDTKSSKVKKLRPSQEAFLEAMKDNPNVICGLINDPKQLDGFIEEALK